MPQAISPLDRGFKARADWAIVWLRQRASRIHDAAIKRTLKTASRNMKADLAYLRRCTREEMRARAKR